MDDYGKKTSRFVFTQSINKHFANISSIEEKNRASIMHEPVKEIPIVAAMCIILKL